MCVMSILSAINTSKRRFQHETTLRRPCVLTNKKFQSLSAFISTHFREVIHDINKIETQSY